MEIRSAMLDDTDKALLNQFQNDASVSTDKLASIAGVSRTAAWNRVQRLQQEGIIKRQVAVLDAHKLGLNETFFIAIKTNEHNDKWLKRFNAVLNRFPEIVEAHRLAGEIDYLLKVQVATTREFDELYKRIVGMVDLYSVNSSLSMEVLKNETKLPL